jgi:hypothetical protein
MDDIHFLFFTKETNMNSEQEIFLHYSSCRPPTSPTSPSYIPPNSSEYPSSPNHGDESDFFSDYPRCVPSPPLSPLSPSSPSLPSLLSLSGINFDESCSEQKEITKELLESDVNITTFLNYSQKQLSDDTIEKVLESITKILFPCLVAKIKNNPYNANEWVFPFQPLDEIQNSHGSLNIERFYKRIVDYALSHPMPWMNYDKQHCNWAEFFGHRIEIVVINQFQHEIRMIQ